MYRENLRLLNKFRRLIVSIAYYSTKPTSSEVLTSYLVQCKEPPWTSYFYSSVKDDQFGMSNFNWKVGKSNYQILRTGCFPYIKYHCSKKEAEDLKSSDKFMRVIKIANLVTIQCEVEALHAPSCTEFKHIPCFIANLMAHYFQSQPPLTP
ncbi:unnamed protein product [Parnassius apollo]|uniref:(apollo) hypothetical protein n=1 Tax=Parnassius apollo TaxID=110799 RepID=A0A8S3WYZ5_PARAO|nr:unnamed protein product [Parnassius apollo]